MGVQLRWKYACQQHLNHATYQTTVLDHWYPFKSLQKTLKLKKKNNVSHVQQGGAVALDGSSVAYLRTSMIGGNSARDGGAVAARATASIITHTTVHFFVVFVDFHVLFTLIYFNWRCFLIILPSVILEWEVNSFSNDCNSIQLNNNFVSSFLGAIYASDEGTITMFNSHFRYNMAQNGGAVYFAGAVIDMVHIYLRFLF